MDYEPTESLSPSEGSIQASEGMTPPDINILNESRGGLII